VFAREGKTWSPVRLSQVRIVMASSSSCASASVADPYLQRFVLLRIWDSFHRQWSKWWREVFVFAKSSVDGCYYGYVRRTKSGRPQGPTEGPTERLDIEGQPCAVVLGLDAARQAPTGILDEDVFWIRAPPGRRSHGEFPEETLMCFEIPEETAEHKAKAKWTPTGRDVQAMRYVCYFRVNHLRLKGDPEQQHNFVKQNPCLNLPFSLSDHAWLDVLLTRNPALLNEFMCGSGVLCQNTTGSTTAVAAVVRSSDEQNPRKRKFEDTLSYRTAKDQGRFPRDWFGKPWYGKPWWTPTRDTGEELDGWHWSEGDERWKKFTFRKGNRPAALDEQAQEEWDKSFDNLHAVVKKSGSIPQQKAGEARSQVTRAGAFAKNQRLLYTFC